MSSRRLTAFSMLLGLVLAGSFVASVDRTSAAMWAVLTLSPECPSAGEPAEVLVRTFGTYGPDAVGTIEHDGPIPAPSDSVLVLWGAEYPFQVIALGPAGETIDVDVHQDQADASLYRGAVTFPSPGAWTLRLPQFPGPDDAPGIRLAVTVAERAPPTSDIGLPAVAAMLGAIAGATAVAAMVVRRRSLTR
jgi:hypothetical protein